MKKVINIIKKYLAIFYISISNSFAYISEVAFGSIFMLLVVFVMAQIWMVVFSNNPDKLIAGFTMENMVWYIFITELITTSKPRVIQILGEEIKSGTVSYLLNKPFNFISYHLFTGLGETFARLIFKSIFSVVLISLLLSLPSISLVNIPFVIIVIAISIILDYYIASSLAMLAFWVEDTRYLRFILQKLVFIFGGILFPLDIYPVFFQKIALFLPFDELIYGPAKLFVRFNLTDWFNLVLHQVGWIIIFMIITKILYEKGIKKVDINGG